MATKICSRCFVELPLEMFGKVGGKYTYLRPDCKSCKNKHSSMHRSNKTKVTRNELSSYGCCVCSVTNKHVLEVHHLHKSYKRFGRSQSLEYNLEDLKLGTAVVLCANDHSLFHSHSGGKNASFPPQTKETVIQICLLERSAGGL